MSKISDRGKSVDTDSSTQPKRKSRSRRKQKRSRKSFTDASTSASLRALSNSSQKANESLSDPAPTKRQPKRKTRDNKGLLSVLRRHEKILQKLSESQQEDDELSELVNGLSHNMLEDALQEEKEITLQNCSKTLESLSLISQGNIYGPEGIAQTSTKQNERPILQNPTFSW